MSCITGKTIVIDKNWYALCEDVHKAVFGSFGNWLRISLVTKWEPLCFGFRMITFCCTISLNGH